MKIYLNNSFKVKKTSILNNNEITKEETKVDEEIDKKSKKNDKDEEETICFRKGDRRKTKAKIPKSYYLLYFFMIGLAGISVKLVINSHDYYTEEDYAVFNNEDEKEYIKASSIKEQSTQESISNNNDTRKQVTISSIKSDEENNEKTVINKTVTKKEEPLVFVKPIDGEIQKIFSDDKVIYSKTLDMWKTHDGVDVEGKIGDIIVACERGIVEKVYDDAFYGKTIVINHGQGYKTSYSNLDEEVYVTKGQNIKKGQKIGKIGNTSVGEIKDKPHIHFMLFKNNEVSDPSSILK